MQEKGFKLRPGLWVLAVVLFLGAVAGLSLADDAFDNDYMDCPSGTRLDAVSGLTIDRTDDGDELRVSWEALDTAALASRLGANGYLSKLTVIVENGGVESMNVALGETTLLVEDVEFTQELTVSVAVTQGDYVISDIAEADFTTGMPAPKFSTDILVQGASAPLEGRRFYYLGFNDLFDNWYVAEPSDAVETRPNVPKFRVGLAHGSGITPDKADDADFEHYRITIEDPDGDFIGYQAKSVAASRTYEGSIFFGEDPTGTGALTGTEYADRIFTNVRLSNRHDDGPASPYYATADEEATPFGGAGLSYGNVGLPALGDDLLFAEPPVEYFDFPHDVFDADGNYTIKAWAENGDGDRISAIASITINAQEGNTKSDSAYTGYSDASRGWGDAAGPTVLQIYGFTIRE